MLPATVMAQIAFIWGVAPQVFQTTSSYRLIDGLSSLPVQEQSSNPDAPRYGYYSERAGELSLYCALPEIGRVDFTCDTGEVLKVEITADRHPICQASWDQYDRFVVGYLDWDRIYTASKVIDEFAKLLLNDEIKTLFASMRMGLLSANAPTVRFQAYLMSYYYDELKLARHELDTITSLPGKAAAAMGIGQGDGA